MAVRTIRKRVKNKVRSCATNFLSRKCWYKMLLGYALPMSQAIFILTRNFDDTTTTTTTTTTITARNNLNELQQSGKWYTIERSQHGEW
jgi:hypothetical protein